MNRVGQRRDDQRRRQHADSGAAGPGAPRRTRPPCREHRRQQGSEEEEQRPDDVELLLDRERPEVLHGSGRVAGLEVVDCIRRELPVLVVQRACQDLLGGVGELGRGLDDARRDPRHGQHERRRRDQPPGTPSPELGQAHLSLRVAAPQLAGDQVPGDNEEHVHPGEAAGQHRRVQVIDHHHRDGDRPQSLDIRPKSLSFPPFPGTVTGRSGRGNDNRHFSCISRYPSPFI